MKRPGAFNYLFGNPVSLILLLFWAANIGCGVLAGSGHLVGFGFALFLAGLSMNSAKQIRAFKQWNNAWTNAAAQPQHVQQRRRPTKATRVSIGLLALVISFAWFGNHPNDTSGSSGIAVLVGLGVLAWLGYEAWRVLRRMKGKMFPKHSERSGQDIVTVCLPIPKQVSRSDRAPPLPDYCLALMNAGDTGRAGIKGS